jgi:putative transposase
VWTARGLVTYYTAFVLDVPSRRVQVIGSTPYPDEAFVIQCLRQITGDTGLLRESRILVCDRDPKWGGGVEQWLATAGVRVVRIPPRAPNGNAYAERFVRSVKEECLNRLVPLGERHLRTALREFAAHYHHERNHQGLSNELIEPQSVQRPCGAVRRRQRVGGILSYYYRAAA